MPTTENRPVSSVEKSNLLLSVGIFFMVLGLASLMWRQQMQVTSNVHPGAIFLACMLCSTLCLLMSGYLRVYQLRAAIAAFKPSLSTLGTGQIEQNSADGS